MSFSFEGFVLRAPRTAPSNATTTDESVNGVDRDFKPLSSVYDLPSPELVELAADQYRASTLLGAPVQVEYLVWAANTANLADLGGFPQNDAKGSIPAGTLSVENSNDPENPFSDGTNRIVIIDDSNRSIALISSLVVRRGDTQQEFEISGDGEFNPAQSIFTITNVTTLELLGGGLSEERGDSVRSIQYTVQAPTFWWSRNDQYENRFHFSGQRQRWEPIKGTPPRNLGVLLTDTEYTLSPAPIQVPVGDFLPGDSTVPDSYCMVRIGSRPNSASTPVAEPVALSGFGGIKVITDDEIPEFSFEDEPTLSGVVGQISGTLLWNAAFVDEFAGQTIFYSYRGFVVQDDIEPLGALLNANLEERFIAPIPGPTDYPFIRIGSRQPLEAILVDSDALLASFVPLEGQVGVSLSTGKLKLAEAEQDKADPTSPLFDQLYLGADLFYDGVSMTRRPVPLRNPVQLVNSGGNPTTVNGKNYPIFVPDAIPTPSVGTSGVIFRPDGTGTVPNTSTGPGIRPGNGSGLVREVSGEWDVVLFGKSGQFTTLRIFDDDDERPRFRFRIPKGTAYIDRRKGAGGSEVILGRDDLQRFDGDALWFLQAGVQPAVFADEARMVSRVRDEFTLEGDEVLVFAIDGNVYTWDASANPGGVITANGGTFTPEEIATSLDAVIGSGEAIAQLGRVIIQTSGIINGKRVGDIEIGYGPGGVKDLTGAAKLGFLPGWKVIVNVPESSADLRWLPDNGTHLGVFRSPLNLNGSKDTISDINHVSRFDNVILSNSISASPIVLLDKPPLEEVAGYDEGVFFRILDGLRVLTLKNYEEVYYEFGLERFSWADGHREIGEIEQITNNIFLGQTRVIEDSFFLPSKGLRLSERGRPFQTQVLNEDFLLPNGGASGTALFIINVGPRVALGGRGQFAEGSTTFTDPSGDIDFVALEVKKGYQLKILQGDAEGTYVVSSDATLTNSLQVEPVFLAAGSTIPWELYEGVDRDEFDLGIVADVQYVQFQHLPTEPWKIRVLSPLGPLPSTAAEQEANRLQAVIAPALASGRPISLRFGLEPGNNPANLIRLDQENLGTLINSALNVPDPTGTRFTDDAFSIRVGDKTYSFANGDLVKVAGALTFPLLGDIIEVQTVSGLLNFGSEVFVQFAGQDAIYVEEFLDPSLVDPGTAEYKFQDGFLNFSISDMVTFGGTETYFVEQMVVAGGQDVTVNPIQGSLLFTTPLREKQIVETEYFKAVQGSGDLLLEPIDPEDPDSPLAPVLITEQLPLFVRLEETTPESPLPTDRWRFNPTDRTVRRDIEPSLWVGSTLYNVGSSPVATFDFETNTGILEQPTDNPLVRMSYAVLEAFGGEQTYTVSQFPVYRPPFRIEADRTRFTLETDRTGDMVPGKLLRVAQFPFYITDSKYDPATNLTEVTFLPETQLEAGSRDPGADSLSLLTDIPLAKTYNSEAPDGFWIEIIAAYEPINRGFQSIFFQGDLTALAVAGHLFELGGDPFIIAGSSQTSDGTKTQIDITSFFPRGYAFGQDAARISARPVYAPLPSTFLGRGGVVSDEGFELILFGEKDDSGDLLPGRTLRPSIDYTLNDDDGSVEFFNPPQAALQPTQILYLRHVQQRFLAPVFDTEVVLIPLFDARFVHVEAPSEENNVLGKILLATYTFSNPDTFFYRTVPLLTYLAEVAQEVAQDIAAQLPSVGPASIVAPGTDNDQQGRLGLKAQLSNFGDLDRAARVFLEFYNETILAFEQILETISGNIIGDRDGKFKFFIGRDKEVPPPGYEDAISGDINRRNIFSELFFAYNPKVVFLQRDPLVNPFAFEVTGDQLEGAYIDPDFLGTLIGQQKLFIQNDVDDVVLIGRTRKKLRLFPLRLEAFGRYRRMGSPSRFSRLFPERADVFTLTDPGIGADLEADPVQRGVYSFRKRIERLSFKGEGGDFKIQLPQRASTFFKSIGDIGNPVLGQIQNVASVDVRPRFPRARVFLYSDTGFPEFDTQIAAAGGTTFASEPRPAVIASIVPLNEFPIGKGGLPDITQLAAQGGDVVDLTTGDPDLFTPPWTGVLAPKGFNQIAFGRPDGRIIDVVSATSFTFEFPPGIELTTTRKIFIDEVLLGCIVTFRDDQDPVVRILPDELLEEAIDSATGGPPVDLNPGDTIFVTPPEADVLGGADPNDPTTNEQNEALVRGIPNYRVNFDVRLDKADGEYVDITFPSYDDPSIFGLKEILGQNPPLPVSTLEAVATFRNSLTEPAPIPALVGGPLNDSGDYSLPYLVASDTEKDRLGVAQELFANFFADTDEPGAVFPDEILGDDGVILGAASGTIPPAVIFTTVDALPVTNAGAYIPHSGIGDARPFDFLFVEKGQGAKGLPNGSMGILSVGGVSSGSSLIEPPRFITPTLLGDRIRYRLKTAMSFVNQGVINNPPGMVVRRAGTVTQFDITAISTGILVFNDGTPAVVSGGLNNLFNLLSDNLVTINLFTAPDEANPAPVFLQSVLIDFGAGGASGDAGFSAFGGGGVTANDNLIFVDTGAAFVTIAPNPGLVPPVLPEDPLNPGDTIPLWFTIDLNLTIGGAAGAGTSTTAFIQTDRLTFSEAIDLRTVLPRTEPPVAAIAVESELDVVFVTSGTTDANTINSVASGEVNGASPFTFLLPDTVGGKVGTFDNTTGRGTLKVLSFEGHGNSPIVTSSPITFAALASNQFVPEEEGTEPIVTGTGRVGIDPLFNYRIHSPGIGLGAGALTNVLPGDICVIQGSSDSPPKGATAAGTYLVKHAIEPNAGASRRVLTLTTKLLPYNTQTGWAQVSFPRLVDATVDSDNTLRVNNTTLLDGTTSAWAPTGKLYFITSLDPTNLTDNLVADYTAVNNTTNEFQISPVGIADLTGAPKTSDDLDALPVDTLITGFFRFDILMDRSKEEQLPRNTVGFNDPLGVQTTASGFREVTITGPSGIPTVWTFLGANAIVDGAPVGGQIGITAATPIANTAFVDDEDAYVYTSVPLYCELVPVDLGTGGAGFDINGNGVEGLWPGIPLPTTPTTIVTTTNGFEAQAGVFFEPSVPRPTLNLSGGDLRVVDAGNSVPAGTLGYRDPTLFGEAADEAIRFEVRRIRRFHDVQNNVAEVIAGLRFAYEIRRGIVTDFGPEPVGTDAVVQPFVVTSNGGTQLGGFNNDDVNITPGDQFRLLDADGILIESVEIGGIEGPDEIWLKEPGFTKISAGAVSGKAFEIYIRNVPVPHEQSNAQLLDMITDRVLLDRVANLVDQTGGIVPAESDPTDPRRLQDTDQDIIFVNIVQEGDIVLIDPAGPLVGPSGNPPSTGQEFGTRPFGDRSVPNRTTAEGAQEVPFVAGEPSELDDNRGWYRITEVAQDSVTVSSKTLFSNDPGGGFVTFGIEAEYAVYPTVSGSTAPFADPPGGPGEEGQMDLRPTALAGTLGSPPDSFQGNRLSIGPFSYKIFRPSPLFSDEAVDLVLSMRERTLSWLEEFEVLFRGQKAGTYFIFQRDQHIGDLGDPTIPDDGKGLMSNAFIDGIRGLVNISPFANNTDALSVLDRRFWINDFRLDSEFPPFQVGVPSYATLESNANNPSAEEGDGRPVLPDYIDDVLDNNDQFRQLRYAWLSFRVNRENGTIVSRLRFLEELPKRLREALRSLRVTQSLQNAADAVEGFIG